MCLREPASGWANMTETAKLTSSDGAADDSFGDAVSISGNTIVVGAENATVGGNSAEGAAYVFTEPGTGWANMNETAKLTASDGAAGDDFGISVAISGRTVVVGSPQYGLEGGSINFHAQEVGDRNAHSRTSRVIAATRSLYRGG